MGLDLEDIGEAVPVKPEEITKKHPLSKKNVLLFLGALVLATAFLVFIKWYNRPSRLFEENIKAKEYAYAVEIMRDMSGEDKEKAMELLQETMDEELEGVYEQFNSGALTLEQAYDEVDKLIEVFQINDTKDIRTRLSELQKSKGYFEYAVDCEEKQKPISAVRAYNQVFKQDSCYEKAQKRIQELKPQCLDEAKMRAEELGEWSIISTMPTLLNEFRNVLPEDKEFTAELEQICYEASLTWAAEQAKKERYVQAIQLLSALETQDEEIVKMLNNYRGIYKPIVLDSVVECIEKKDYQKAFSLLNSAKQYYIDDEKFQQECEEHRSLAKRCIFEDAEQYVENGDYRGAAKVLEDNKHLFDDVTEVNERIAEYTAKFPVSLKDVTIATGENWYSTKSYQDIYGNVFVQGLAFIYYGSGDSVEYVANGNYDKLTGVVMVSRGSGDLAEMNLKIYADGVLKYDSGVMTKKTEPIELNVDITGATFVKIVASNMNYTPYDRGEHTGNFMIADPVLGH